MKHRSVIEILVLMFSTVIAISILLAGIAIAIIEIVNPEADTTGAVAALANVLLAITGALLGLMVGQEAQLNKRDDK